MWRENTLGGWGSKHVRPFDQRHVVGLVALVVLGAVWALVASSPVMSWVQGVVISALLIIACFLVARVFARRVGVHGAGPAEPVLLVANGHIRREVLNSTAITESDLIEAMLREGIWDLTEVKAAVLETNGALSVIPAHRYGDGSALDDVPGREDLD